MLVDEAMRKKLLAEEFKLRKKQPTAWTKAKYRKYAVFMSRKKENENARKKLTIVGAGRVGSSAAWLSAVKGLGDIVLVNRTENTAKGIALDISQSLPVEKQDISVIGTSDYAETKDSDVIIITAGAPRTAGAFGTREQLIETNSVVVKDVVRNVARLSQQAVMIVVTNPLDAMVAVAAKQSEYPKKKVLGMAGILDSARFASFIAEALSVSV